MHDIKAILFDLDGTLMDTDDQSVDRVARILSGLRIPGTEKLARKIVMAMETPVNAVITFFDRIGLDAHLMKGWHRINRKKDQPQPHFRMIEGIPGMLALLKGNYKLAVVTTRSRAEAEHFLKDNSISEYFSLIVTRESTRRIKPHPEPILFAADGLGIKPSECLMVGDTTMDILSAKAAGATSAGVLCGFGTRGELEKAGATIIIENTVQLGGIDKF